MSLNLQSYSSANILVKANIKRVALHEKIAPIHPVTTMLPISVLVKLPGHKHLLSTMSDLHHCLAGV